jgi:hypothetical protein
MARPKGSPNKMTRERDAAAKELAEEYGDPLEGMLVMRERWQKIFEEQLAKPSRHRNTKKLAEAEAMIKSYNVDVLPFMRSKYQSISHNGDVGLVPMVVRAPKTISDSKEWLETYRPKEVPFIENLRTAHDIATELGIDDAAKILNAARNHTDKKL